MDIFVQRKGNPLKDDAWNYRLISPDGAVIYAEGKVQKGTDERYKAFLAPDLTADRWLFDSDISVVTDMMFRQLLEQRAKEKAGAGERVNFVEKFDGVAEKC
jgi:hypothetical protein